jgi:hypothetical protein
MAKMRKSATKMEGAQERKVSAVVDRRSSRTCARQRSLGFDCKLLFVPRD